MKNIEERLEELLGRMTLYEKITLLSGRDAWNTMPLPRLGIPAVTMTDGPHGVRASEPEAGRPAGPTTAFPTGIALASSWNTELVERVGQALAEETLAMGCDILLGPCVNIVRTPLAGRNFEAYSEDPYLAGRMAVAWIKGLQSKGAGASLKHYAANNQETDRMRSSSEIDERTLREIYLPHFEMAVKETRPWTVMCSYNRINGTHASQHGYLLKQILKEEWGFEGAVISDWGANHTIVESLQGGLDLEMPGPARYYGKLLAEAVNYWQIEEEVVTEAARRMLRLILRTGKMDGIERPAGSTNTSEHHALAREAAEESITLLKNEGGLLPLQQEQIQTLAVIGPGASHLVVSGGGSAYVIPEYRVSPEQGLRAALGEGVSIRCEQGVDNYVDLPVLRQEQLASQEGGPGWQGEYFPNGHFEGQPVRRIDRKADFWWFMKGPMGHERYSIRWTGRLTSPQSGRHTLRLVHSSVCRLSIDGETLIDSSAVDQTSFSDSEAVIEMLAGQGRELVLEFAKDNDDSIAHVKLMFGYTPAPETDDRFERAVQVAREADAVVLVVGNPENYETEGRDRPDMELPGRQNELVHAVLEANPRTVVVISSGAPVALPWYPLAPAVVQMYYPGMEGGSALARVLLGEVNPSGKLTVTYPHRMEDTPAFGNSVREGQRKVIYGEGILVGYRHYDARRVEQLLPFGHGLSYTTFEYTDLQVPERAAAGEPVRISVTVRNTGKTVGKEVVQLYVSDLDATVLRPPKELKRFRKIYLEPDQSQTVQFELDERALAFYQTHPAGWVVEPGKFEVLVGSSSADIRLRGVFEVYG